MIEGNEKNLIMLLKKIINDKSYFKIIAIKKHNEVIKILLFNFFKNNFK